MFKTKFNALNDRSKQILSVFTKTVSDLTMLNEDIAIEVDARYEDATRFKGLAKAEEDKAATLVANSTYNLNVIAKINSFLED
jgi:hypothetical protein